MTRRKLWLLAAATLALGMSGCASMKLKWVADDLKAALAGEPVEVSSDNGAVKIRSSADYMFTSGGWQLKPGAPILSKMVPTLSKLQNTQILVAGYTDNTPVGSQLQQMGISNNYELSLKRANAAVEYLQSHGVNPHLLVTKGFGEDDPIASNDTPAGRAKNRRIEMTLTGDGS
jgi:chemotaxis protein MotB